MAEKRSILAERAAERRAKMQEMRNANPQEYAQTLEQSASKTVRASERALSQSEAPKKENTKEKQPSRLVQEMNAISAKLNGNEREDKRKDKEREAREARDKDVQSKQEDRRQIQQQRNFNMLANVFKDQSDKMIKALKELMKNKKDEGSGGKKKGGGIFDMFDIDDDDRRRRPHETERDKKRRRRLDRIRNKGKGRLGRAWNRARGFGERVLEGGESLLDKGKDLLDKGGEAVKGGGKLGKTLRVLGHVGTAVAAADALYNAAPKVGTLIDSKKSGAERAQTGAHLAIQGAGGVIGGVLGGVQGAAWGADIGDKVADGAEWAGEKLRGTEVGDALGKAAAIAMSPFSEDAREALKSDWKNNILPDLDKRFTAVGAAFSSFGDSFGKTMQSLKDKFDNLTEALPQAGAQLWNGVKGAGASVWKGITDAGGQVADGWRKKGLAGALQAVSGTASKVGDGIAKGWNGLKEGVSSAGSTMRYAAEKGTANPLDLAMGFSAKKGFKGMNDSQSKAYAANVMKTESGGKLDITNQYGFAGQYQFGADALAEQGLIDKDKLTAAKKAAGKSWYSGGLHKQFMEDSANWTNKGGRDAFLKDKQLQDDTFVKYTNKNIEAGFKSGALNANSSAEDIAAYAKAAHLKGAGGANDYFLRGIDSADANGTKVSDYARGAAQSMSSLAAKVDAEKAKGGGAKTALAANGDRSTIKPEIESKAVVATNSKPADKKSVSGAVPSATTVAKAETKTDLKTQLSQAEKASKTPDAKASVAAFAHTPADDTAPVRVASATSQAVPLVSKTTPPEAQTVNVANQPEPAKSENTTVVAQGGGGGNGPPTLDEMPIFISDMGLVLLNTGHV